ARTQYAIPLEPPPHHRCARRQPPSAHRSAPSPPRPPPPTRYRDITHGIEHRPTSATPSLAPHMTIPRGRTYTLKRNSTEFRHVGPSTVSGYQAHPRRSMSPFGHSSSGVIERMRIG